MKTCLTYIFSLLITILSAIPSSATIVTHKDISENLKRNDTRSSYHYSNVGGLIKSKQFFNQARPEKSSSKEEGPQISQAQDATVTASVIQVNESFAALIAILFLYVDERIPITITPPHHASLFSILFRVIISTNAP